EGIIKLLKEGKDVALISDGGMPLISDPGHILVKKVREEGLGMTVLPGANAALCALVLSGIDSSRFSFVGFLPEGNKERKLLLDEIKTYQSTLLFHISPHSLQKDLNDIFLALGKRHASLAREISKVFEEVIPFVLGDRLEITEKGEFVLVVEKAEKEECKLNDLTIDEHLSFYLSEGLAKNEAIKRVSKDRNVPKNEIYIHVIKKEE
ncbi:MAG: SAM-dependent methyltransferase, partial [Clostridia bacterium]